MDMWFEWLKDREANEQFRFFWRERKTNLADYFIKHHSPAHHCNVRADFLTRVADLKELRERFKKEAPEKDTAEANIFGAKRWCKGVLNPKTSRADTWV